MSYSGGDILMLVLAVVCLGLGTWTGHKSGREAMFKEICEKQGGRVVDTFECAQVSMLTIKLEKK